MTDITIPYFYTSKSIDMNDYEKDRLSPLGDCWIGLTISNDSATTETAKTSIQFPEIKKVIFNDPATIVWFEDGTKVIVKKSKEDSYSKEHAILYAIAKRLFGAVQQNGDVESNGFMARLKKIVANGIDQVELAKKAAMAKKAKKNSVPQNHPKTKAEKPTTTDSSVENHQVNKYYAKKSNLKKD